MKMGFSFCLLNFPTKPSKWFHGKLHPNQQKTTLEQ